MLPVSLERNIKDRAAIHLFYIQAVRNVIDSNYPCEPELAAALAGLQLQLALGDNKPDQHKPPYLRYIRHCVRKLPLLMHCSSLFIAQKRHRHLCAAALEVQNEFGRMGRKDLGTTPVALRKRSPHRGASLLTVGAAMAILWCGNDCFSATRSLILVFSNATNRLDFLPR